MIKHGEMQRGKHSKEADIWIAMLQRCYNENCESYANYGGRGIVVCDRWRGDDGLQNFIADMGRKPAGRSLDRIDNNGPYGPDNCRWATKVEQQRNRRANRNVTIDGETHCLTEWAERLGISIRTVSKRIHKFGWTEEKALLEPVVAGRRSTTELTAFGKTQSLCMWERETEINSATIKSRLECGWEPERALTEQVRSKHRKKEPCYE